MAPGEFKVKVRGLKGDFQSAPSETFPGSDVTALSPLENPFMCHCTRKIERNMIVVTFFDPVPSNYFYYLGFS